METQINRLRKRQRRSSHRQIEVVGGGLSAIQRLEDGRELEVGRRRARPGTANANYRNTNTTVRKHKNSSKL
jgi:hypothetical protein